MFGNQKLTLIFVSVVGFLVIFSVAGIILWHKEHRHPLEDLAVIEHEAVEIPIGGGKPRFIQEIELDFPEKSMRSRTSLTLFDSVPAGDILINEKGWRIPALFGDRPFSIPVLVKKDKRSKILEFQLNDLKEVRSTTPNESKKLIFSYETQSSLDWLKGLVGVRYTYSPKELDLGRPAQVALTLNIGKVNSRIKEPGLCFFVRKDLPDLDIEVIAVPLDMVDLSTNAAYLFLGDLSSNIERGLILRVIARRPGTVKLERAVIVGGYLDHPIYRPMRVEGAKRTKQGSETTVSYLGNIEFSVKDRGRGF